MTHQRHLISSIILLLALSFVLLNTSSSYGFESSNSTDSPFTLGNVQSNNDDPDPPKEALSPGVQTQLSEDFFPFGFMSVEDNNLHQMDQVVNTGVNCIHSWHYQEIEDGTKGYLDLAAEKDLSVIQQLPGEYDPIRDESYWAEYIPSIAEHDNVVAWYLPDELPDYDPNLEHAEELYTWVKKYDPGNRPIYGNAGSGDLELIRGLVNFSDMVWFATYPNYYGQPRVHVTWAMKERLAPATQGTGKPYGAMIEFFDPKSWGHSGDLSTPEEIRCDVYQALIAGAKGIWFYSWYWGTQIESHEPTLEEISRMADEILGSGGLREVFLSPEKLTAQISILSGPSQSPSVRGISFDSIQWTQREHNGVEYIFAVNVATEEVRAEFHSLPIQNGDANKLFENQSLSITDGSFVDTFQSCEVHLYSMATQQTIREDLNLDGVVNILDAQLCIDVLLQFENEPNIRDRADVNADGEVNSVDLQQIINHFD